MYYVDRGNPIKMDRRAQDFGVCKGGRSSGTWETLSTLL